MLVLSRRITESLQIGDNIEVSILDVSGNQVKIGITAPRSVPVLRSELANTIRQNAFAARTVPDRALQDVLQTLKG